ncbi:hypothetical protein DFQ27_001742 [Actinomortierella ambigua]|uniref:Uncharacterized protein n=1 Tax=Actinomortierella ambigua TaxID=1343610 RepID=A0A9P6QDE3_9FUNG|nr:hypothetical protein DFQ27_001742 [Actinomortierella ambigua]
MSSSRDTVAADSSSSFLACPCLNVKLHLPTPVDNADSLAGTLVQLGLGGVSMEQKILGALTLTPEGATVSCSNCNQDVYTFEPTTPTVKAVNKTSIAFLTNTGSSGAAGGSTSFSPSNGRVIPQHGLIAGKKVIEEALAHPDYSHAFRLILFTSAPTSSSKDDIAAAADATTTNTAQADSVPSSSSATVATSAAVSPLSRPPLPSSSSSPLPSPPSQQQQQPLLPSYLQRIRTLLDQELEASLMVQEQRTHARIAAYKSQQLLALAASQEQTIQEKEKLWRTIQQRVAPPATVAFSSYVPPSEDALQHSTLSHHSSDTQGNGNGNSSGIGGGGTTAVVHPFEIGTLPIRFSTDLNTSSSLMATTMANGGGTGVLPRWLKPAVQTDVATSLQLKEFDDRMHSIGMRRQSRVSGPLPQYDRMVPPSAEDLAASQVLSSAAAAKTKKKEEEEEEEKEEESRSPQQGDNQGKASPPPQEEVGTGSDGRTSHGIGAARHITIVEPAKQATDDDTTTDGLDHIGEDEEEVDDDEDDDEDIGVVFDLDEELGFDDAAPAPADGTRREGEGEEEEEEDGDESDEESDGEGTAAGVGGVAGKGMSLSNRPASSMVVGSLRLNYLRRQKKLEAERQRLKSEERKLDEELKRTQQGSDDEDDDGNEDDINYRRRSKVPPSLLFGSSLPIQIHRPTSGGPSAAAGVKGTMGNNNGINQYAAGAMGTTYTTAAAVTRNRSSSIAHHPRWTTATSTTTTATLTQQGGSSGGGLPPPPPPPVFNPPEQLTLPPASSPAGEMLRRRLSRTYGTAKEGTPLMAYETAVSKKKTTKSPLLSATTASIPKDLYMGPGTIAIDPFMLLDDDYEDEDDHGGRGDENDVRQGGRRLNGGAAGATTTTTTTTATTTTTTTTMASTAPTTTTLSSGTGQQHHPFAPSTSLARSAQPGFEPPHIYSARTYVGSTPWEMPTRVTVKAGGADREGADLDMQLTLQMARELEEAKRTEKAELREAARRRKMRPQQPSVGGGNSGGSGGAAAGGGGVVEMIREESELAELEEEEEEEEERG